jgi:hypothetical protein
MEYRKLRNFEIIEFFFSKYELVIVDKGCINIGTHCTGSGFSLKLVKLNPRRPACQSYGNYIENR